MSTGETNTSTEPPSPEYQITHPDGTEYEFAEFEDALSHQVTYQLQPPVDENPYGEVLRDDSDVTVNKQTGRLDVPGHQYRRELMFEYAHAIPTYNSISYLSQFNSIVEIGAGTGYWAFLLEQAGVDVTAIDQDPGEYDVDLSEWPQYQTPLVQDSYHELFTTVEEGTADDAGTYADRALFLCWPANHDDMAVDAVSNYDLNGGDTILYLGEGPMGTHGNREFFRYLDRHYWYTRSVHNLSWTGYADALHVYTKQDEDPVSDTFEPGFLIEGV